MQNSAISWFGAWRLADDVVGGEAEEILAEAADDPEIARNAPYATPVRRLDEVGAAKRPVVRQAL